MTLLSLQKLKEHLAQWFSPLLWIRTSLWNFPNLLNPNFPGGIRESDFLRHSVRGLRTPAISLFIQRMLSGAYNSVLTTMWLREQGWRKHEILVNKEEKQLSTIKQVSVKMEVSKESALGWWKATTKTDGVQWESSSLQKEKPSYSTPQTTGPASQQAWAREGRPCLKPSLCGLISLITK